MNADVNRVAIIYKINFTLYYDSVYRLTISGLKHLFTNKQSHRQTYLFQQILLQSTMDFCIYIIDLCENVYNDNNNFMNNNLK